jgi:hypothetical protein
MSIVLPLGMILLLAPQPSSANMALPSFIGPAELSGAASKPAEGDLTIHREALEFTVTGTESAVEVEYQVEAAREGVLTIKFISPKKSRQIRAWVNDEERSVATARFSGTTPPLPRSSDYEGFAPGDSFPDLMDPAQRVTYLQTVNPFVELDETAFTAPVLPGMNRIKVTYFQEFGVYWVPKRLFTDPGRLNVYPYELWPLKEWTRAADFHLDLTVKVVLPTTGAIAKIFRKTPVWKVYVSESPFHRSIKQSFRNPGKTGFDYVPPNLLAGPLVGELLGGEIKFSRRMGTEFPDRLFVILDKGR